MYTDPQHPTPHVTLYHGNNLDILPTIPDNSIDSIVTDPPYELGFMGKKWDASGIAYSVDLWTECLRVLKPGGHLLAFGGTRTYHRMTVAIEDAGFEIRDSIHWLYGSGFPKSHDVSKAIDKRGGYPQMAHEIGVALRAARESRNVSVSQADRKFCDGTSNWSWFEGRPRGQRAPTPETFRRIVAEWPELGNLADMIDEAEREVIGSKTSGIANSEEGPRHTIGASKAVEVDITAAATAAAREWEGWGTALKPAHEPIVLARKPLHGTVANNVLQHGTGALNIDACRIRRADGDTSQAGHRTATFGTQNVVSGGDGSGGWQQNDAGRWPANIIIDDWITDTEDDWPRYFYCAKPSKAERNTGADNKHPTVKPLALIRYLIRLITPPHGTVLDPFAGSGTTLAAAIIEGINSIGIELTDDYLPIIHGRCQHATTQHNNQPQPEPTLFDNHDN